jgi:hypothetical protein
LAIARRAVVPSIVAAIVSLFSIGLSTKDFQVCGLSSGEGDRL